MILEKIAEFIIAHWRIFGVLFIIAGIAIYEHHDGYEEGLQLLKDYQAKENAEKLKAVQDNERLKTQLEEVKNEAQTRINDYINTHPAKRVLLPSACPTVETKPASGVETAPTGRESLSISVSSPQESLDRFMADTEQLMKEADTTVNQCRVVMGWANQ